LGDSGRCGDQEVKKNTMAIQQKQDGQETRAGVKKASMLTGLRILVAIVIIVIVGWAFLQGAERRRPATPLPPFPKSIGSFVRGYPRDLIEQITTGPNGAPLSTPNREVAFYDNDPPHGEWFTVLVRNDSPLFSSSESAQDYFKDPARELSFRWWEAVKSRIGGVEYLCGEFADRSGGECVWHDTRFAGLVSGNAYGSLMLGYTEMIRRALEGVESTTPQRTIR